MNTESSNKYTALKRSIYLVIFPILFVTNASYWLFSPYVDGFMRLALPPLCLFLVIVWFLIYFKRWIRTCEIVSLIVFGLYHLVRVSTVAIELEEGSFNVYVLWSTTYFIYIFMVLERKRALAFAFVIFILTIVTGIPHFDHITSSFGVTSFQPHDKAQSLTARADRALYKAKKSGRNMVQAL